MKMKFFREIALLVFVLIWMFSCSLFESNKKSDQSLKKPTIDEMIFVPAGEFWMGCNPNVSKCGQFSKSYNRVYVESFYVDKYEVTVKKYRECIRLGQCTELKGQLSVPNSEFPNREDHPVNCVNWVQAKKYCKWAGKRLPREAEWEKAARGTDERMYPWGNGNATCEYSIINNGKEGCGRGSTWPVGSKPKDVSPYGVMDMAGNVSEWVLDGADTPYFHNPDTDPPKDPGFTQVPRFRGGNWRYPPYKIYHYNQSWWDTRNNYIGFRCAKYE